MPVRNYRDYRAEHRRRKAHAARISVHVRTGRPVPSHAETCRYCLAHLPGHALDCGLYTDRGPQRVSGA